MIELNELLHELGISKVKLAKFLGVSRQMIYNYLELDDINKWPKDKKVLLLNLLGVKSVDELTNIKIDTDYISQVEMRLESLNDSNSSANEVPEIFNGLNKDKQNLLLGIIDLIKELLEDSSGEGENTARYLYHYLQSISSSKELKYLLAYVSKETGFIKPMEFVYNDDEQFIFESIIFSAMVLYRSGKSSKTKLAEAHKRFVNQIEQKLEDKLSRTMELNNIKAQALKELGISEITEDNASEVFGKIAEIQSRKAVFEKSVNS